MSNIPFRPMPVTIGSVDASNAQDLVVGRDALVDRLWEELRHTSLQVLSERRMGKTWVLHLAQARQPADFFSIFLNVEDLKSAEDFAKRLLDNVYRKVPPTGKIDRAKGFIHQHMPTLSGQDVGTIKVPHFTSWKEGLPNAFETYQKRVGERMPVIILDELPHMLDSIVQAGRHDEAAELLDTLRALRQSMPKLRMVYCGSLGFHIVSEKLRGHGYRGRPLNDMATFDVPPLEADNATLLAGNLIVGEKIETTDLNVVAGAVAETSSRVPFYVQHMVNWMTSYKDKPWTPEGVLVALKGIFDETGDPLQFKYYDHRLDDYYPDDLVENARIVLDILSHEPNGLEMSELLNRAHHCEKTLGLEHEDLLKLLETLREDHYIVRRDSTCRFKLEIVRQWWYESRGKLRS